MTTRDRTNCNFFNFTHAKGIEIFQIILFTFLVSIEILNGCFTLIFVFLFIKFYFLDNYHFGRRLVRWTADGSLKSCRIVSACCKLACGFRYETKRSLAFDSLRLKIRDSRPSFNWLASNLYNRATDFSLVGKNRGFLRPILLAKAQWNTSTSEFVFLVRPKTDNISGVIVWIQYFFT